jgi:Fanconi anemia group M protein
MPNNRARVCRARNGLADLLRQSWASVAVRRLEAGDVAIGDQVLVERKTTNDLVGSLADGRLFRQARQLAQRAARPIVILEGDPTDIETRVDPGSYRGALLALTVGFRIPILYTRDLEHTAVVLRHMAAQETKRDSRRRRRAPSEVSEHKSARSPRLSAAATDVLCALPGVGRSRAEALALHLFPEGGSLSDLAQLGVRDLMAVPGIGPDTAARIVDTMRGKLVSKG